MELVRVQIVLGGSESGQLRQLFWDKNLHQMWFMDRLQSMYVLTQSIHPHIYQSIITQAVFDHDIEVCPDEVAAQKNSAPGSIPYLHHHQHRGCCSNTLCDITKSRILLEGV